jgi:hypothetical protein
MVSTSPSTKDSDDIRTSPAPPSDTSSQLDDTYEAYKNNQGVDIDPAEAKQTLKKIDTRIVPILFFAYLLQYLDKNGINYASAFGLQEGTNLKGQDYSWLGTYLSILPNGKLIIHRKYLLFWIPGWPVPSRISTATPPHG